MGYRSRHQDVPEMFDSLQADVRREFLRTRWRDTLWAGLIGAVAAPVPVYCLSMLLFGFLGLELSMDLEWSERGRILVCGLHPFRAVLCELVFAWGGAAWVLPKLHARRMKRLWGN